MRKPLARYLHAATCFAPLALSAALIVPPNPFAHAQGVQGPPGERAFCASYNDGGPPDCEFATWDQCQAAISGLDGTCEQNIQLPSGPGFRLPGLFRDPVYAPPEQSLMPPMPMPPPPDE